jgi:hypothetical protein
LNRALSRADALAATITLLAACSGSTGASDRPTAIPSTINEAENSRHVAGIWSWNGAAYDAVWANGATAVITVGTFTSTSVVFNRVDAPGSVSAGMTAVYEGTVFGPSDGGTGGTVMNGSVTWTWPGHSGYPATGMWSAAW